MGILIASLDFMLSFTLIPRGLINHGGDDEDKLWRIQRKGLRISGGLVENQRPTVTSFVPCYYLTFINLTSKFGNFEIVSLLLMYKTGSIETEVHVLTH